MNPPARLLVDASVWCAAADRDEPHHAPAARLLESRELLSLDLTLYEVANVAVRSWRSPQRARSLLSLVASSIVEPPIAAIESDLIAAIAIADEHGISVYDATYAAVARRLGCQLVSCDVRDLVGNGLAVLPTAVQPTVT